ncbi:unnamed protein product [Mytilus coruscus]|uniref:Zinc finger PHD-type domain-containing protein n=1 Tax=Mytilus coruscus TaxID=42192 RepID=A0A6J8ATR8_MYTCO|nr:unnamed protein product [Mytilus coruscus]
MIFRMYIDQTHVYTLSVYYTTCRLLVNGEDTDRFMKTDLPNIHNTIKSVVLNGNRVSLQTLNNQLEEQLQQLLIMRNSTTNPNQDSNINIHHTVIHKDTGISKQYSETISIKCIKRRRNVQTRGVYCTNGKHWIHYRCGHLTEDDIHKIENSNGDYTCKICTEPSVSNTITQYLMLKPPPEIECCTLQGIF